MRNSGISALVGVLIICIAGSMALADAGDDYRVIKRAVDGKTKKGEWAFFKLLVLDNRSQETRVQITLPVALFEMISECADETIHIDDHCQIDLKQMLKALLKHGPFTIIEARDEDATVRIWFE